MIHLLVYRTDDGRVAASRLIDGPNGPYIGGETRSATARGALASWGSYIDQSPGMRQLIRNEMSDRQTGFVPDVTEATDIPPRNDGAIPLVPGVPIADQLRAASVPEEEINAALGTDTGREPPC